MSDLDAHLPGIVRGDAGAFARWLAGAEPSLRDTLRPYAARVDTEAVVQEALLRIWQIAPRHAPDGRPNSLLRLSVRIARNLCIDDLRRTRAAPMDDDALERALARVDTAPPRTGSDPLLRKAITDCREGLPEKPARALASRLGMRLNTFLQNFTRARKLLAECLGRRNVDIDAELA